MGLWGGEMNTLYDLAEKLRKGSVIMDKKRKEEKGMININRLEGKHAHVLCLMKEPKADTRA